MGHHFSRSSCTDYFPASHLVHASKLQPLSSPDPGCHGAITQRKLPAHGLSPALLTPTTIEYMAFFLGRPLATFISLLFCKEVAFEDKVLGQKKYTSFTDFTTITAKSCPTRVRRMSQYHSHHHIQTLLNSFSLLIIYSISLSH
jgi:hypothetical protein